MLPPPLQKADRAGSAMTGTWFAPKSLTQSVLRSAGLGDSRSAALTAMASGDMDGGAPLDLSVGGRRYPCDLRDGEWMRLEPLIPGVALQCARVGVCKGSLKGPSPERAVTSR